MSNVPGTSAPRPGKPPAGPRPVGPAPIRAARSACRWASPMRWATSRMRPGRSGLGGGANRPASHRLNSRTTSETTRAAANSATWTPSRVQNTESKPTLWYQIASVHSSMPMPARNTTSATTTRIAPMPTRRRIPPSVRSPPSLGPPAGFLAGRRDEAPDPAACLGVAPPDRSRLPDRRRRIGVGSSWAGSSLASSAGDVESPCASMLSSAAVPSVASPSASGSWGGEPPSASARRRSRSRMNSSNRSPIATSLGETGATGAGWTSRTTGTTVPSAVLETLHRPAETGQHALRQLVGAHRLGKRRLPAKRRPDRQRAAPRP
jgi:hypothetical protein